MRLMCPRWWCLGWLRRAESSVRCNRCTYRRPLVNEALVP